VSGRKVTVTAVTHVVEARCQTCTWSEQPPAPPAAFDARDAARAHAQETGHDVQAIDSHCATYGSVPEVTP
jgi:hypothetical protein